ncbi:unnamed protein product, partial [Mesorhabditis spiculigera]
MTAATSAHLDGDKFVMQVYKAHVTKMRENLAHEAESKENFEEGETAEQYMERQEQEIGEAEEMIEGCIQLEASIRDKMAECMEDAKRIRGMQREYETLLRFVDRMWDMPPEFFDNFPTDDEDSDGEDVMDFMNATIGDLHDTTLMGDDEKVVYVPAPQVYTDPVPPKPVKTVKPADNNDTVVYQPAPQVYTDPEANTNYSFVKPDGTVEESRPRRDFVDNETVVYQPAPQVYPDVPAHEYGYVPANRTERAAELERIVEVYPESRTENDPDEHKYDAWIRAKIPEAGDKKLVLKRDAKLLEQKNGTVVYEVLGNSLDSANWIHYGIHVTLDIPSMEEGKLVIGVQEKKLEFMMPDGAVGFKYTTDAPEFTATFTSPPMQKFNDNGRALASPDFGALYSTPKEEGGRSEQNGVIFKKDYPANTDGLRYVFSLPLFGGQAPKNFWANGILADGEQFYLRNQKTKERTDLQLTPEKNITLELPANTDFYAYFAGSAKPNRDRKFEVAKQDKE